MQEFLYRVKRRIKNKPDYPSRTIWFNAKNN